MMKWLNRIPDEVVLVLVAGVGAIIGWTLGDVMRIRAVIEDVYISLEEQRRIAIAATERELERIAADKGKQN